MANRIKWSLVEIADHQGVMNVGGRLGAAAGPKAFRDIFFKMKSKQPLFELMDSHLKTKPITLDIKKNHSAAIETIKKAAQTSPLTVIIGGGHDHGYTQLKALREHFGKKAKIGCINIDAHLDVRKPSPEITSGSPFWLALEDGTLDPKLFIEFGIQPQSNAPELWKYVENLKIETHLWTNVRRDPTHKFNQTLQKLARKSDFVVVSLDLDAAAESFAPGVSAPQAEGFTSSELAAMMEIAGNEKKVCSLGVFELNPLHDLGDRTSRLAATCVYRFLSEALSKRGPYRVGKTRRLAV